MKVRGAIVLPHGTGKTQRVLVFAKAAKADEAKGSPKTFDAGIGIYAVTAVLSVTGMAWTAKKRH